MGVRSASAVLNSAVADGVLRRCTLLRADFAVHEVVRNWVAGIWTRMTATKHLAAEHLASTEKLTEVLGLADQRDALMHCAAKRKANVQALRLQHWKLLRFSLLS